MFKDITLGQYYPVSSFIHHIDARVKLLFVALFITILFLLNNFWSYALIVAALGMVVYASKVPPGYMFRGLKSIIFIVVFTSLLNIFFQHGETVLVRVLGFAITLESLLLALKITARLVLLLTGTSLLTLTTTPIELTDAIEFVLKPFKRIGVPSHEIAMMMTIALRFIPTLLEEMDKIMKAQTARGADFETGGLLKKARALLPLLIPLFVSAFRRADELAIAMESRCYRGDIGRTKMKVMTLQAGDFKAMLLFALGAAAVLAVNYAL